jgi:uncharacterized membrane protein YeaQ/YmgE (transglycosylase-associated protein family)
MNGIGLLWTLIIGALAGFLAGQLVKGRGFGLLVDIISESSARS